MIPVNPDKKAAHGNYRTENVVSETRYKGLLCVKHPELEGLRSIGSRQCIGCRRADRRKWLAKPETRAARAESKRNMREDMQVSKAQYIRLENKIRLRAVEIDLKSGGSGAQYKKHWQTAIEQLRAESPNGEILV